jgi:hypothetical protein
LNVASRKAAILAIERIISCINASDLRANTTIIAVFGLCAQDLARMLIAPENEGEYTDAQEEYAGRGIRG